MATPSKGTNATGIKIVGIATDEIAPSSRGGQLRSIPLKLSAVPSDEWADAFVETWDHPPRFGSMHQSRIARVEKDRLILDGTTVEIIEAHHHATLQLVIDSVNRQMLERDDARKQRAITDAQQAEAKRHQLEEERQRAAKIRFD